MRLTRLRLNGFKSFADPTELLIQPGLTGVVGPNGCGKSNLLEALRWVMGETRPTQMRGGGMEDVIFAGTQRRGARAFAEVALHFDRDAGETELVRRISRDGGSAYRLGGREARARDVQVMFADAASGAQSPALVRQGQIAELIGAKPGARRRVIEEAAGIAGLQARRAEAAQKLAAAEANLSKVAEVAAGLADRLKGLERQARNAEKYREIAAAIRLAEGRLLWRAWCAAEEAHAAADGEARTRAALALRAEAEAARTVGLRAEAETALPPLREAVAHAAELVARLKAEGEAEAQAARRAEERLRDLDRQAADLSRDARREEGLAGEAASTLARLSAEALRLSQAAEGEPERATAAREAAETAQQAVAEAEAEALRATEAAARLGAEAEAAGRRVAELARARDRAGQEAAKAASALAELQGALARAEGQGARAAEDAARAEAALGATEARLAEAEAAVPPLQEAATAARAGLAEAEARAAGLATELSALERLVAADGSRAGQIGAEIAVPEGFEAAVAAALGRDLRAGRAGDGSGWAVLPSLDGTPLPQGATPLSDLVTAPPELARRLAQVGLTEDGEALWPHLLPGQRLVSRAGDLWRWDGLRTFSRDAGEAAAEAEAMRRAGRLPGLRAEAETSAALAREAKATAEAATKTLADALAAVEAARAARRAAERQAEEARRLSGRADADRALAGAKLEAARDARARAEAALESAGAALSEAEATRAALADPTEARAAAGRAQSRAATARSALMAARAAEEEARRRAEGRARRAAEVAREEASWRDREAEARTRARDLADRRARLAAEAEAARAEPGRLLDRAQTLKEELATAETSRRAAEAALSDAESTLRSAQDSERAAERAASEAREARAGAEAAREAAALRVAEADHRLREERGQSPRELLDALGGDPRAVPSEAEIQIELASQKRRRDALGPVNLRAEEDARALRDEQGTLLRESADLSAAVEELRRALSALNREGREKMLDAFGRVNAEFGRLFKLLFGGGEARLALVDADDPLEAGVEIMAQPPGKTLGTLSLLSGGEQTLTAIALIFAVFLVAPSPVCVLDEVDAPLDDANVGRFCDLLDAMARDTATRFLVITHHAVTMARMDRLYGVTMAERGVSQLVSVDLRAAEALVA